MAKKLYAVTNIKCGTGFFDAGSELDPSAFEKDDLKSLYDAGALRIEDVPETADSPEPAVVSETEAPATEETPEETAPPAE